MRTSEALWEIFRTTGHIGAYLLYKDFGIAESATEEMLPSRGFEYLDNTGVD